MASSISAVSILFGLNSTGFDRGINGIMGKLGGLQSMIAGAFAGVGAFGAAGWALRLASEAEMAQAQLEVLLGSVSKAQSMLADIRALDVKSPFGFQELTEASKRMLAYGMSADEIIPTLTRLSEVAMGDAFKLDRLSFVMGQVKTMTRMSAQDLRQFTEAGLNPLAEIARLTGMSMEELQKKVSDGAISYELVSLAIQSATAETGRFYGANERFAKTLAGDWAKLTAEAQALGREIGSFLVPAARAFIGVLKDGIGWLRSWDASQLKLSATTLAFGVTLIGAMNIIARIPAMIKLIVSALKAMASAQILTQALSGPKGWAVVTASLVAAGVATGLVYEQFKQFENQLTDTAAAAKDVADSTKEIGAELPQEVLEIKKKMEIELGLSGDAKELAEGTKAFAKALNKLKPDAFMRGSADAESAINKSRAGDIVPFVVPVVQAINQANAIARQEMLILKQIRDGQQLVQPAVI